MGESPEREALYDIPFMKEQPLISNAREAALLPLLVVGGIGLVAFSALKGLLSRKPSAAEISQLPMATKSMN